MQESIGLNYCVSRHGGESSRKLNFSARSSRSGTSGGDRQNHPQISGEDAYQNVQGSGD